MKSSAILLVVVEPADREILSALLTAGGERADSADSLPAALDAIAAESYDLIIADADLVSDIRSASGGAGTVPMLALAGAEAAGADTTLARPFTAAALTSAVQACLGDVRMAAASGRQTETLGAVIGAEQAMAMIGRYLDGLADGIAQIEAGGDARAIGHRLGGMGGMLGFNALGVAWLGLECHGLKAWATVRELTLEAIERHRDASSSEVEGGVGA